MYCCAVLLSLRPSAPLLCCGAPASLRPALLAGTLPPHLAPTNRTPASSNPPHASNPHCVQPGVWFPEERGALRDRRALLAMASEGSARFELNRTPWQIASDPVQLGFGIYLD